MFKKTKKNTYRNNNNNKLTKLRGGSSSEPSLAKGIYETGKIPFKIAEGVARGTAGIAKGVSDVTGVTAAGQFVKEGLSKTGEKISSGIDKASNTIQESSVKASDEIKSSKEKIGKNLSKAADFAGEYAPTTLLENELKRSGKFISDKVSGASDQISDKTKKAIEGLEKVTQNVGIDRGSVGNFMLEDENCKFDVPSAKNSQIENKTESDVKNKLNKSKLFGDDQKFKKYMTERILKKCREYHDVTKNNPDKYFMRFYNHCSNLFACFDDVTELVYLFNDTISGDLSFLTDIQNEKSAKDKKQEVDLKVEEKKKELEEFTKQQENRLEEEKKIGESEEETKQRLAKQSKKKEEIDKYVQVKEAKMQDLEDNKRNLEKQIKNVSNLVNKLKEYKNLDKKEKERLQVNHPKTKVTSNIEDIHFEVIEDVLASNRTTFESLYKNLKNQRTKLKNELDKKMIEKVLPDIKSKIEKELEDIYSEYVKALENRENKKDSAVFNFLKYKAEETKRNKFLIKYSYYQAEEDKLRKRNDKYNNFIKFLKNNLIGKTDNVTKNRILLNKNLKEIEKKSKELEDLIEKIIKDANDKNEGEKKIQKTFENIKKEKLNKDLEIKNLQDIKKLIEEEKVSEFYDKLEKEGAGDNKEKERLKSQSETNKKIISIIDSMIDLKEQEPIFKKTIETLKGDLTKFLNSNGNNESIILTDANENLKSEDSEAGDTKSVAGKISKLTNEIKKLESELKVLKDTEKPTDEEDLKKYEDDIVEKEGLLEKSKEELEKAKTDYSTASDSSRDSVGVDMKINILVFFRNNVFIANVKEYAILNSSKEFKFKDDLSRELSKIIEYNKFKEQIEKLDKDKEFKSKVAKIGDVNFIDNKMFETIKIEKRDTVEVPAFDMNDLYKKLKNDKDVKKNIYDYYKMLMQLEMDIDSGKVKMDEKFEEDKFGPNMYMYIVLGFLGTALSFELANLNNVRAAMGN